MKLTDVKSRTYTDFGVKNIDKKLNLKLVIMLEYQNLKNVSKMLNIKLIKKSFCY